MHLISSLINTIDNLDSPIVAGLDTTLEMIPDNMKQNYFEEYGKTPAGATELILSYNKIIIDSIHDLIPAVKLQIAMYEAFGISGIEAYNKTAQYARDSGLLVIGDIKRGDIGSTASAYASHLSGVDIENDHFDTWSEDMITLNPYLGKDSLLPFVDACKRTGKACFILVKTSNPGSANIQDLISRNHGKPIYETVGEMVSELGKDSIDNTGYNNIGAVVGATHKNIGTELRQKMPNTFFLVPGYGAQGAKAEDLRGFFDKNKRGAIINSSRGIIASWQKEPRFNDSNIGDAARETVLIMKKDLKMVF